MVLGIVATVPAAGETRRLCPYAMLTIRAARGYQV
jgi:hypothetical protein